MKPRALDLFCGDGGAGFGLHLAGFDVVGVDIAPQPRYPFAFHQADAMTFPLEGFDFIWASPPCQRYSQLFYTMEHRREDHPDLVDATRVRLIKSGAHWTIENVYGAPLARGSIMLCGGMHGLRTYRHRIFESSVMLMQPHHPKHVVKSDKGSRRKEYFLAGGFISVVGNVGSYCGPAAMGIDWMTGEELSQAIPPAYSRYIGDQMMPHVLTRMKERAA
jgi:DNA (cytosine-5)-methyltransferase 1